MASRDEHNRECFELWLLTRSERLSTRPPGHPDEYHGRAGKRGSQAPQDVTWIDAIATPDCVRTDSYLRSCLRDLERWEPDAYGVLHTTYISPASDPAAPERWRKENAVLRAKSYAARTLDDATVLFENDIQLHLLEDAFVFVVYRMHRERRVIYWPDPEEAFGVATRAERQKRIAHATYFQALEDGDTSGEAIRKAIDKSHAKRRNVYYWLNGRASRAKPKPNPKPLPS